MQKPSLKTKSNDNVKFILLVGKRVHSFSKGINKKVNIIARLEFEHAYYDIAD